MNPNSINGSFIFSDVYVGTIDDGMDLSSDGFFTVAAYQGAVETGHDWTNNSSLKISQV